MSENKPPSEREVRSWGDHSANVPPAPSSGTGLDGKPFTGITVSHKISSSPEGVIGMFDPEDQGLVVPEIPSPRVIEPITLGQTELKSRRLKFKAETRLYRVKRDANGKIQIPYTPVQEADLFDRELAAPTYLNVPVKYLEIGARGGTVTKKVGQSDYGAFTVALYPVRYASGEVVMEERLVSYLTRSSKKEL